MYSGRDITTTRSCAWEEPGALSVVLALVVCLVGTGVERVSCREWWGEHSSWF